MSRVWLGALAFSALAAMSAGCGDDETPPPSAGIIDAGPDSDSDTDATVGCSTESDCSGDLACCDGACVDLQTNGNHCGACYNTCSAPSANESECVAGSCTFTCATGYGDCDLLLDNGCETSFQSDPTNCGGCGEICLFANAEAGCESMACVIAACKPGFADCNDDPADGCEVDLSNDPSHCNECGTTCEAAPNAQALCLAGQCGPGPCLAGFADCDSDLSNGCEIDLFNDPDNCAACGTTCPVLPFATTTCTGAICSVGECEPGRDDCDHSVWSGCESDLASDVLNCNGCGNACSAIAHGFPACTLGVCGVGGCDAGYGDCDGDAANGCEVNLANDPLNCAVCDNACPPVPNGNPVCAGFQCGIGTCETPFADCFGGAVDGCETNLHTSVDHCGLCPTICPSVANGSRACSNGTCGIDECATGYGDCNNASADGCEITFANDVMNCGSCGNICPTPANGVAGCAGGSCTLASCNAGYSDCNGNASDGCEFNTLVDPNNCGGCGIVCGSGSCVDSKCVCSKTVLLIADDSPTGTAVLAAALGAAGYTVTQTAVPSHQYNGTNPALTGFGAVVLLAGGPGASFTTDMPAAGQAALVAYVNAGNGLVLTEWAAYHVASGRWATLSPVVLLTRSQAYTGQVSYTVDSAFATHPIWAGLPASFTFASTSNVGLTKLAAGVTRVAGSPQAIDAMAIRDTPAGRVAHLAHAGNYAPNGWSNANIQKLVGNAVSWVARCQ